MFRFQVMAFYLWLKLKSVNIFPYLLKTLRVDIMIIVLVSLKKNNAYSHIEIYQRFEYESPNLKEYIIC